AIPFLPSLLSKAFAADPVPGPAPRFFLAFGTMHGDVWGKNQYPNDALLTQKMNYAGRDVRYGNLPATPDENGNVVWSPMCRASAQVMTPALAKKFNILRGVDVPYTLGHQDGANLGAFADGGFGGTTNGLDNSAYRTATIDQVMAYSPSFYTEEDLNTRMTQRSFGIWGGGYGMSWNFSNPANKSGQVVGQPSIRNNKVLFDYFFQPGSAFYNVDTFVVDRVKQSYDRLKKDPRLSKGDLARLNQHVERMSEVERKLTVIEKLGAPPIEKPTTDSDDHFEDLAYMWKVVNNQKYCELMNDIIVAAFSSGVSRVGTWSQSLKFLDYSNFVNSWHGQVAHNGMGAQASQGCTLAWNRGTFEHGMVGLAAKLDAVTTADGSTLLDNSLLMQTSESGQNTHHAGCVNYPMVMAGGAGGYFKTGMFVDFGNKTIVYDDLNKVLAEKPGLIPESPGLYYQQFLGNVMHAMGIPANEWETFTEFTTLGPKQSNPTKGYGFHYVDPKKAADYEKAKLVMGDKLPVIT
ncbi:MAG TPA: DUF1552 domain-containing protein, partial [Myxococcales bacterium]|nr:DUF1552 domain-containing protein [Myxococcales bacterium]